MTRQDRVAPTVDLGKWAAPVPVGAQLGATGLAFSRCGAQDDRWRQDDDSTLHLPPEMGKIWTDQRRYDTWLEVETVAAEVMAEHGLIPAEAARDIREKGAVDAARVDEDRANDPPRHHRVHDGGGGARGAIVAMDALWADVV